ALCPAGGLLAVASFLGGNSVSVFSVDPGSVMLSQVPGSPFVVGSDPVSVAFSPDGSLLAVANSFSNNVSEFSVNKSTGALSPVPGSPFAAGSAPWSVTFSPRGGLLAVANSGSNDLSVFSVNQSSGALSQVSGSPFTTGTAPHSVVFSPDGKLLAIANNGSNNVTVLSNTVVPTSRFAISRIKSSSDGAIRLLVRVPGAGSVDVVVTARDDNRPRVATLGRSKAHRI